MAFEKSGQGTETILAPSSVDKVIEAIQRFNQKRSKPFLKKLAVEKAKKGKKNAK